MFTLTQLEAMRPALDDYNRRNKAARDQYATHPIAICSGWREDGEGNGRPCLNERHPRDVLCQGCRKAAAKARRATS